MKIIMHKLHYYMLDAFISKKNILLLSYKKDFSQTFPHIHIMYLKSVHAHSLAIFLASQLFLEYSCAMKSHFRKFGNQMSGSGNHLCNYASLLA